MYSFTYCVIGIKSQPVACLRLVCREVQPSLFYIVQLSFRVLQSSYENSAYVYGLSQLGGVHFVSSISMMTQVRLVAFGATLKIMYSKQIEQ